jgi:hypothetical protein
MGTFMEKVYHIHMPSNLSWLLIISCAVPYREIVKNFLD